MKRRSTCTAPGEGGSGGKNKHTTRSPGGGEKGEKGIGSEGGNTNSSNNNNRGKTNTKGTKKTKKNPLHPPPPVLGTVATRTRRQQRDIATKWKEPLSILITIMGYTDPDTIRVLCCVSQQFRDLIYHDPRMENNRVIPLFEIRPAEDQEDEGRIGRLLRFLYHHRDKVQLYRKIKIIDANKFDGSLPNSGWLELFKIKDTLRLNGVVSLDMSLLVPVTANGFSINDPLSFALASILPNLREINLSGTPEYHCGDLLTFTEHCPRLEKITKNNIGQWRLKSIGIDGEDMRSAQNLKEIIMDNSAFWGGFQKHKLSDLENDQYKNSFLFHRCSSKVLEKVSIRNATTYNIIGNFEVTADLPQNALIKFVRKAPKSLRWFRSNLTTENMTMLRSERPEIELVN